MIRIIYPREQFERDYRQLIREVAFLPVPVSLNCQACDADVLVLTQTTRATSGGEFLRLELTPNPDGYVPTSTLGGASAVLILSRHEDRAVVRGWVRIEPGRFEPADELCLIGPEMFRISLSRNAVDDELDPVEIQRWSRSMAALDPGVWGRLRGQAHAIIGLGRSGSSLARMLAQAGVQDLRLCDPDRVELHNLGESALPKEYLGANKVDAIAVELKRMHPSVQMELIPQSVTSVAALNAAASAHVLWSTVDHNSARLVATALASLFHKPLFDIGTGIFRRHGSRLMGADVRLVWPGRCLLCTGGLARLDEARGVLASASAEQRLRSGPRDFRQERAGSLASLNLIAVGTALRCYESFLEGRLRNNGVWIRILFTETGELVVEHRTGPARPKPLRCMCRYSGLGEGGLADVVATLRRTESLYRKAA